MNRLRPTRRTRLSPRVDAMLAETTRRRAARHEAAAAAGTAAFRATVEERLKSLEAEIGEVRTRVNGLLFLSAGAVLTQVALRLLHR
jgi:hypothetical protein